MTKKHEELTSKIIELLEKDPGQTVKVNRTFLAGYLKALESQGRIKLKEIAPAKVYFNAETGKEK